MLWQQTVAGLVWVLALNRWLAERDDEPAQPQWMPVVNQDGDVVQ